MSGDITQLDDSTISQIAAGEVVERPASVVKEVVENSLDAGASRIDVTVEGSGADFLQVADDGHGMSESAVRRAIKQHTTSKIRDIEDLETDLSTLGFRGEALYTIGAVSRLTITTRPRDGGDTGTELRVVAGDVTEAKPAGRAPGTTVTMRDLFFNKPARRKFLKSKATEFAHVNRVVTRYALANPDVAITLTHDGNDVFNTTGRGDLQETIHAVYGREVATGMIEVDADPGGRIEAVRGFVSDPETTRASREYVSTFVNGRYVREGLLRDAILSAYGNQLAPDRYPFAVLFLEVPPETVDVNVHPRKMEVRFDDETAVSRAVEMSVQDALLEAGLVRTSAPRGRSAPEETPVEPGDDSAGPHVPDVENEVRSAETIADAGTAEETDPPTAAETGGDTGSTDELDSTEQHTTASVASEPDMGGDEDTGGPTDAKESRPSRTVSDVDADESSRDRPAGRDGQFEKKPSQARLSGDEMESTFTSLPPLEVLGQIEDTYIVAESPDGLVLIDQHAADERITYERLASELASRNNSQQLVSPVELEVTPQEGSVFEAASPELADLGFEAHLAGQTVVVEAVPAVFAETLSPNLVRDVLSSFLTETERIDPVSTAADALLADMACYPSITGNTSLSEGDVIDLLEALDACENPYACPHGRPVVIEITTAELADRFERDYPGHQTRRPED